MLKITPRFIEKLTDNYGSAALGEELRLCEETGMFMNHLKKTAPHLLKPSTLDEVYAIVRARFRKFYHRCGFRRGHFFGNYRYMISAPVHMGILVAVVSCHMKLTEADKAEIVAWAKRHPKCWEQMKVEHSPLADMKITGRPHNAPKEG